MIWLEIKTNGNKTILELKHLEETWKNGLLTIFGNLIDSKFFV